MPTPSSDNVVFESFNSVSIQGDEKDCVILSQGASVIRFPVRLISEVIFALGQVERGDR